jgi:hypothetical protein
MTKLGGVASVYIKKGGQSKKGKRQVAEKG